MLIWEGDRSLLWLASPPLPSQALGEAVLEQSREQGVLWLFGWISFPRWLSHNCFCPFCVTCDLSWNTEGCGTWLSAAIERWICYKRYWETWAAAFSKHHSCYFPEQRPNDAAMGEGESTGESWTHGMVWVLKDFKARLIPPRAPSTLNQAAQSSKLGRYETQAAGVCSCAHAGFSLLAFQWHLAVSD